MLCNSSDDLDTLFSSSCLSELETVGCKPILSPELETVGCKPIPSPELETVGCKPIPSPDLKAKISVILRMCDDQILNHKEEDIKI